MRLVLSLVIALSSACASTSTVGGGPASSNGRVNVAAVRAEINAAITATTADRSVSSMGKATVDKATVYTTSKDGARAEESWSKTATGWKLDSSTPIATR